jgi:biopolymer transport protein ExbB
MQSKAWFGSSERTLSLFPRKHLLSWAAVAAMVGLTVSAALAAQADPAPAAAAAETAGEHGPQGLFSIVFSGGPIGVSIMLLLLALSLTAAYLGFEHLLTIRRNELMPDGFADRVRELLLAGRVVEADQACRQQPCLLSFVLLNGLAELDTGWTAVEKAMEDAMAEQSARLFRRVEYLSVIGNIAPMVGLLGTVVGLIMAFYQVAATQGAAGAGEMASGIYHALVSTVAGLIIAIPALGVFAIFRNRIDQLVAEAAYLAQHAMAPLKRRRLRGPAAPAAPPAPPPVEGVR